MLPDSLYGEIKPRQPKSVPMGLPSPLGVLPAFLEEPARKGLRSLPYGDKLVERAEQPLPDAVSLTIADIVDSGADHVQDWWCAFDNPEEELRKAEAEDSERFNLYLSPLTWKKGYESLKERMRFNDEQEEEFKSRGLEQGSCSRPK